MWSTYHSPRWLDDALRLLAQHHPTARVIAGGTDVVVELQRGQSSAETLIDLTNIGGLDGITLDEDQRIHIGPLVTHNEVVGSDMCRNRALPLVQACFEVGAPQIRNRGTVAGNVASASPANDTITALVALEATVTLASQRGRRHVAIDDLIVGPGETVIAPDELIVDISIAALEDTQRGLFVKLGLRHAQAIAVVNMAAVLTVRDDIVARARLGFGSVAGTIVRATDAEATLTGSVLDPDVIEQVAAQAVEAIDPVSDIRGSADYRRYATQVLTRNALAVLADGRERDTLPTDPVMLWGEGNRGFGSRHGDGATAHTEGGTETIDTVINGESRSIAGANDKTLLQMLRDVARLSGTKEACGEGECGACTVLIDGSAAMSCLVPAPQAHGRRITTVEGLAAADGTLHPVQQAFIDKGALQCGFCTPGLVVSGVALYGERPAPTTAEIKQAICGNLCRCTSYYPIVAALEAVAPENASRT